MEDVASRHADYIVVLAESDGDLLYEELHKSFSLCDELVALEALGLVPGPELRERAESAVRSRLRRQARGARLVPEDRQSTGDRLPSLFGSKL